MAPVPIVNPKAMVHVFRGLEKLLKRIGNKHLVLELAQLTIAAAKLPPRDVEDARAQAQAIICGESWVMQRTGRLDEARVLAQRSLTFGEDINYDRNTAFCMKCTGRILRLQAERLKNSEERGKLLAESEGVITAAMERFQIVPEIGATHPEIGDCYSLLGRTYLVAKQFDRAQEAVQKAYELIPPDGSKEHLDLLILTADLQGATGAREAAETTYCEALGLPQAADVQKSEIFARGFFQRGANRERLARQQSAIQDYRRAAEIWLELGEFEFAAQAQWAEVRLASGDDTSVAVIGQEESYLVRVLAFRLLQARFTDPMGAVVARRRQPSKQQIDQILKQARAEAAIEYPQW